MKFGSLFAGKGSAGSPPPPPPPPPPAPALGPAPNLLTDASPAAWTPGNGAGGLSLVSGALVVAPGGGQGYVNYGLALTTTIGRGYTFEGRIVSHTGSPAFFGIRKSDNAGATTNIVEIGGNVDGGYSQTFTATATITFLVLQCNTDGLTATFDLLRAVEA